MANYYMVRAMSQSLEDFDVFFKNDSEVVAVGWSDVNFSIFKSPEDLVTEVSKKYYKGKDVAPQVISKKKNEVRRFKELKKEDKILVPFREVVRLAVATGKERFSSRDGQNRDLANQHVVAFRRDACGDFLSFPRNSLSEGLQRRLRVRGTTIANLNEFAEEIATLFQGEAYTKTIDRYADEQKEDFQRQLLGLLQDGSSALQAGGIGLEKLVKELLDIDGYIASIQSKHRFPEFADADIEAIRDDHVTSVKFLVQVKHHSGTTGEWGAQQLSNILKEQPDLFSEYQLVLVTTASASEALTQFCNNHDITLITGHELVGWITDSWSHLSKDDRRKLRIGDVPQIAQRQPPKA